MPEGWEWKQLEAVVTIHDNLRKPIKKRDRLPGNIPYCGANGVIDSVEGFTHDGDFVLLAEDGGFYCRWEKSAYQMSGRFWANNHVHILKGITNVLENKWLVFTFTFLDLRNYLSGATRPKLNQKNMRKILIPLPPIAEQRRIVACVEELVDRVEEAQNLNKANLSAIEMLVEPQLSKLFMELSKVYNVQQIGAFADVRGGKRMPKGQRLSDVPTPFPYIRVADMKAHSVDMRNLKYVPLHIQYRISRYTISSNDVYVTIAGTIGYPGLVPDELDGANLTENAAKIVFRDKTRVFKEFLVYMLRSAQVQEQFKKKRTIAAQTKLALHRIASTNLPLPPTDVQQKIASYLGNLESKTNELRHLQSAVQKELDALVPAILDRAFKGRL